MKVLRKYFFLFFFLFIAGKPESIFSQEINYKAYTLFLYNFMKYIEWPDNSGDLVVGIVGKSPIQKELAILAETKNIKGRKIVVKIISQPEEILSCQMVYVPSEKSSMLKQLSEKAKGKPILLIGEREGLAQKGAALSFFIDENDTLRFDINKSVLESHNLKIAKVLLQVGTLVG